MPTTFENRTSRTNDNNANQTSHYYVLTFAIVLGLLGTFLRFVHESTMMSVISNILLAVAWLIAFRIIFKIIK